MRQPSTSMIPQTASQRYTPKWDLWINGFLHQAVMNVINSLMTIEIETSTKSAGGTMLTASSGHAAIDKLEGNVLILKGLVLESWMDETFRSAWTAAWEDPEDGESVNLRGDPVDVEEAEKVLDFQARIVKASKAFNSIWQLFERNRFLRLIPERTLAK